ncbi:Xylanase inhibitor, C-terminal [Dillenia turbinata]|uniref:Xylanase inhibitor, C-terminal n=1 Tax=Dillenia turbinata TaxID=194707 RepID=A0AAN8YYS3_9MAGN
MDIRAALNRRREALKLLAMYDDVPPNGGWPILMEASSHYGVDVEGIEINGQVLPIDPKVFKSSRYRGAIFDSGSTFVSLIDDAYVPFARNVKSALSHLVPVSDLEGDLCYESSTRAGL